MGVREEEYPRKMKEEDCDFFVDKNVQAGIIDGVSMAAAFFCGQ